MAQETGTTDAQIESMRLACEVLNDNPLVKEAVLDDWGRYGNFTVLIYPAEHTRGTTSQLKGLVRRTLKNHGAHMRQCFPPEPEYQYDSYEKKRKIVGYNCSFWKFDIDFMNYSESSNSFN
ncbi:hypothetical protein [Neptuniibacter sp. QD37_11]|uniref:hypothetical protein n=1 Tax=Neptuniibacter sp. QD37_11 TaxID=3398209 RepID=UPI0039F62628